MSQRAVIDLAAFAAALPPEFKSLKGKARRWFHRHSCDADLGVAESYLADAVRWNSTKRESLLHAKGALLQSAVIHYARAFDPASKHRSQIKIEPYLDEAATISHGTLIDLRHESLAHFGPAGEDGTPWSEDIPALIIEGDQWQTMIASRRSLYRDALVKKFLEHLQIVRPIVRELSEESKAIFSKALNECWSENELIGRIIAENKMDPDIIGGWSGPFLSRD